jgi:hypothetical protein
LVIGILKDEADLSAHATKGRRSNGEASNVNGAVRRLVDPVEVQHQRALPRSVWSEQCHLLASCDVQVDPTECFGAVGVAKVEMLNMDPTLCGVVRHPVMCARFLRFAAVAMWMGVWRWEYRASLVTH